LSCINDSLSVDYALSELRFAFKIRPVMENMHSTSTDDVFSSAPLAQCCTSKQSETVKPATCFILPFRS